MKATEKSFLRFLEGSDKHFIIPIYQRNYDWDIEQCEQLYNDIIGIIDNDYHNHFMGTIVSIYYEEGGLQYLIIDGQQRITTLSLLLLALYNLLQKKDIETEFKKEQIRDEYLINKYLEDNNQKIRLKPIKSDSSAYLALFSDEQELIEDSNITYNYQFFYNKLQQTDKSIDEIFTAIKKLFIVEIELKKGEDNPQLIFESINSTGLSLKQADLVRNFILMDLTDSEQRDFYERYWNKIERNTGYNVSDFIRHYLTLKERNIPKQDKVYLSFKKYSLNKNIQTENLLIDLLKYSKYYYVVAFSKDEHLDINSILIRINKLNLTVSYPFLLELYNDLAEETISKDQLIDILTLIESFSFRRLICSVPTNALNKIYMTLGREIKNHDNYRENYVEIIKYLFKKKTSSQRFPDDNEFSENFMSKDIYNLKNNTYLLERIENFDNREKVDVYNLLLSNDLSIEHIMPKKLSDTWKTELGTEWQDVHDIHLNTIGNLTLTGYNREMSNKPFNEKKTMDKGFLESKLKLNAYLKSAICWNENAIIKRAEELNKIALKIWKYPDTDYIPRKDIPLVYSLTDDHNFTGEKISSFSFQDNDRDVSSWKHFYEIIAKILYKNNSATFKILIDDDDFTTAKNKKHISDTDKELRSPIKIAEGIFIEGNLRSYYILENIRKMFEKYGFDEDDLMITLALS